jgi:putative PIN family toxin of toxin-antitoxin system
VIWAVVDTNVLVSGMGWSSRAPGKIVDAILEGRFFLVSSEPLLEELERILHYPKLARVFARATYFAELLRDIALMVHPLQLITILPDDPDNRLLEAAVTTQADVIVSGDDDILALGAEFHGIRVLRPTDFIAHLEHESP